VLRQPAAGQPLVATLTPLSRVAFTSPDVLVLGGGGVAGVAWLNGVLAGIEASAGTDFRRAECLVGTSAGSIIAARLSAGKRPRRPREADGESEPARADRRSEPAAGGARAIATDAAARGAHGLAALGSAAEPLVGPFAALAMAGAAPGGALGRRLLLGLAPRGQRNHDELSGEIDRLDTRFDGRLRVCTVERSSGRRVVFGAPGAPDASIGQAVAASCAIPGVFEPVRIGGRDYVDGGVWSPTNLDAAVVARGTQVLCLNPLGALGSGPPSARSLLGGAFRLAEGIEATLVRRRGALVQTIVPDAACVEAMGVDLMSRRSGRAVAPLAFAQGLAVGAPAS